MKLTVFGATGQTGQRLVAQALARGHAVTAVARRPKAITERHANLTVLPGSFADPASLDLALRGAEVVLSAIGAPMSPAATSIHADSARAILAAMGRTGVKRLICITSGGTNPNHDPNLPFAFQYGFKRIFGNIYRDQMEMEKLVMASACDWTIVRPAQLTNGPATGRCRNAEAFALPHGNDTPRADLADFMLDQAEHPTFSRKGVALAL
ncbi:MAG: SDR family oxidoreductase [Thermoflexales bacterium]